MGTPAVIAFSTTSTGTLPEVCGENAGRSVSTDQEDAILYTSGRVPVDIVEKAITAGVPILASKTVPTVEAVELARRFGLVIIGSARADSMKVFT